MNHLRILIVDDDLNKISTIIKTIREIFDDVLSISQASSVYEAIENLQNKEFHLLITDLQMPLKHDDAINEKGGESLIRSIYKTKNKINIPLYIIGLTQYEYLLSSKLGIWNIWLYDSSEEHWKLKIRDLIHHIILIKSRIISEKIETVFVEGPTDKKILETTIKLYFPLMKGRLIIETIKYGGGASWVERQLFIWAKSLTKKTGENNYLKAVGIFDNDEAGNKSIKKIRELIASDTAETRTFSIVKNSKKYSPKLKSISSKGITFPTTIEDLVMGDAFTIAKAKGWLTKRELSKIIIDPLKLKIVNSQIDESILRKNKFDSEEILTIMYKIDDNFKVDFCNYICNSSKDNLISISYLINDLIEKLKIIN